MPKQYPKIAQSYYHNNLTDQLLDKFLEKAWYRMGPSIFTTHFINYEGNLFSTIWLRTILKDYSFSKSLRKIDKKNRASFTHITEPYQPSPPSKEIEELYSLYKQTFKGPLPDSLSEYMLGSLRLGIYNSYLVKIYDGEKLIACSIFDVGRDAIASIFGFFDPAYKSRSLGLYTMLLEIEFCQLNAIRHYYVGYFLPGNPRFDYKLRIGHQEYFDLKSGDWLPMTTFTDIKIPIEVIRNKLSILQATLDGQTKTTLKKNAYIDVNLIEQIPMHYLEDPFILIFDQLNSEYGDDNLVVCTFDIRTDQYKLMICEIFINVFSNYFPEWIQKQDKETNKHQLVIRKTVKRCKTLTPIKRWIATKIEV